MPVGVALGEVGGGSQLLGRNAASQNIGSDVRKPSLLLRVNADVVAMDVGRQLFRFGRIERKAQSILQRFEETFRGPAVLQKEKLEPRSLAILAQDVGFAEELGNSPNDRHDLVPLHEGIQANSEMRIGGKTARYPNGEAGFRRVEALSCDSGKADIINLWVGAPGTAPGNRDFELAGKIVELALATKLAIDFQSQRRSAAKFVRIQACQRAAGHVAGNVPASAGGRESHAPQTL